MNMRYYLFLIILFSKTAFAQDSCYTTNTDKFTGKISLITPDLLVDKTTTTYAIVRTNEKSMYNTFTFSFNTTSIRSVDENSSITILYKDGTKDNLKNQSSYNLEGHFSCYLFNMRLGGGKKILENLTTKKINAIRLSGFKDSYDADLTEDAATTLRDTFKCIYDEWVKK